jgi:succinoglycan biosynthesis transport protein ExoP
MGDTVKMATQNTLVVPRYSGGAASNNPPGHTASTSTAWDYWDLVKQRKLALIAAAVLGAGIGFVVLLFMPHVYGAATTIELQVESLASMAVTPQASASTYSPSSGNIGTQIKIIQSNSVLRPVYERMAREIPPTTPPTDGFLNELHAKLRRQPMDPVAETRDGLILAFSTVKAKLIPQTTIISISCDSTIPQIASSVVNAIAQEYVVRNAQLRSTTLQQTSQWLESQMEETRAKLEQAESQLQEFSRTSGVQFFGTEGQTTLASNKLTELLGGLTAIETERISTQAKYDLLNSNKSADSIPEIADDPRIMENQSKLVDAQRQLAQLSVTLTPEHYKVKQVQDQINTLQDAIQKEHDIVRQRIKNEYEGALRKENLLKAAYAAASATVTSQSDKASKYGLLKAQVEMYRTSLTAMSQQVNQTSVISAAPSNTVRVIDAAGVPGFPYKPDPPTFLGVGAFLGLAAGIGIILLKEIVSKRKLTATFGNPGYASAVLSLPELGVIPTAELESAGSQNRSRWLFRKAPLTLIEPDSGTTAVNSVARITWKGGASMLAESFRLTLTSLTLMSRNGNRPRVLVVTSPGAGEGKTTVSSNIAIAMAEAGRSVLLIDMDLRRPQLHTLFGLSNDRGFSDLVRSGEQVEITDPILRSTSIPRVSVLTAGTAEAAAISELFHSPKVGALLTQLRSQFDTLIIDTPPMLQFSESRLVASLADGVILVVRSGVTDKDSALAAKEQLATDRIEVIGAILNDWTPRKSDQTRYASYYSANARQQRNGK